jgi:integrase
VQTWYLHLEGMGARSKNNHLAAVQGLFTLPALAPHPHRAAILALEGCRESVSVNALWTPEEFKTLLHTALRPYTVENKRTRRPETHTHLHLLPVLVLGGFAKVRASEIRRIRWPQIDLDHARLKLPFGQTKTQRTRIVPLPAAAVAWLRLVPRTTESLWPWHESKFIKDCSALAARCNLSWRKNALRNSATTYDHLLRPDLARVAREAGNSAAVLEREYLNLDAATVENARAWFAILPPEHAAPVVPMPHNATQAG